MSFQMNLNNHNHTLEFFQKSNYQLHTFHYFVHESIKIFPMELKIRRKKERKN